MNKIISILRLVLLATSHLKAKQYQDYVVIDNLIWGLTSNGEINLFDKATGKPSDKKITNNSEILLLTKDKLGNAVIADKNNEVKKRNEQQNSWEVISKFEGDIFGVVFDSKNVCYAIMDKGIQDLTKKKIYF
jgi:hypothetical protein